MRQLVKISIVIVIVSMFNSRVYGDICDICVCKKSNGEDDSDGSYFDGVEEFFSCNGIEQNTKETHQPIDLNSIPWPSRNGSVSARFNNFKLTYLTK